MASCFSTVSASPPGGLISPAASKRLDSWKEIATLLGRTIRTVQRWERSEDLPVYRHVHEKMSSVYAFESELLAWRDNRSRDRRGNVLCEPCPARRLRLAVLPFVNLSEDPQLLHFEDGLTYEIISQLARLDPGRLAVIARTSVMRYKRSVHTITQVGKALRVDYVLEGGVRVAARRIRIAAQLIVVSDQTHVFADACSRRLADGASIQIAFADRIAKIVDQRLLVGASHTSGRSLSRPPSRKLLQVPPES